ncbi:hypothetical protein GCM10022198_03510 [Klugiella xanthotipulae]|uniref:Type III secretion system (T3SS) SseB-like protein n=1 Tax=Klugiella xanthotipulae TaxID=244735 RepID=A0A543I6W9_9MICO|nr:SseB family protein [Klugiella xanthotipulae]TQM66352.1 type III secretion system (T3SS) SseB-like protein [Klugiella xanthotipulae]
MAHRDNETPPETPSGGALPDGSAPSVVPEGVTADYRNDAARAALDTLMASPDYTTLAAFLRAISTDYLVVDVSGSRHKKGTRIRTVRSTQGQLILPLFTSMAELRAAVPVAQRSTVQGAVMPAITALTLITTDSFVAAQFDAGSAKFIVLRKFISRILTGEEITAEALEKK